ncbi:MAG: flagellar hook-associated protein FlgK [Bdellovibrionaceae bacterium]|nr:flagellar hook-associated protein FlgK [Bdellovibrio sp.]
MAKIHGLLDMGRRGMQVSQSALQTTSHNIANKSVEGFSRQRVDVLSNPSINEGKNQVGTGSTTGAINRSSNPWIEKQLEREGANFAYQDGKANSLSQLESAFNEQTVKGLNNSMTEFFNGFRELANNPESLTARTVVKDNAQGMIQKFQDMDRQIDAVTGSLNKTIEAGIGEVNGFTKEIATLNEKIQQIEMTGAAANDERDRRDLLVKKLSEKLDISYAEDSKSGMLNITAGKTGIIVAGTSSTALKTTTNEKNQTEILYELSQGGTRVDITDQFKRGALGGSIDLRDGMVHDLKGHLEELSYNIASEVNKVHNEGYDRYNKEGVDFFDLPKDGNFIISDFKLNQAIADDVGKIAAASKPNAPGDNTTANVMHSLQFKSVMGEGQYTFDSFYNAKVGEIGVQAQRANSGVESQKNIVDQLKNMREATSGVSLDEEAAKMIEFQKSFEASARVVRMADEMFETVLNLKRL